jgi:hypothetical protein
MSIDPDKFNQLTYGELWTYVQRLSTTLLRGLTRVGVSVLSGSTAIAGATLMGNVQTEQYGKVALGASVAFGVWFVGSVFMPGSRRP